MSSQNDVEAQKQPAVSDAAKVAPTDVNDLKSGYPPGFSDNVMELLEKPSEMLNRVLQPNETIVGEFECYFPDKMIPRWKIVLLLVFTCGLYALVLLYRSMQRWCYRKKFCTPNLVHFTRGKMGITNFGRIICWSEQANQAVVQENNRSCIVTCLEACFGCCFRDVFRPDTVYNFKMKTQVYSAHNVRQITQFFRSEAGCLCWCLEYTCGIELSFGTYNFRDSEMGFMSTAPASNFVASIQSFFSKITDAVESTVGVSSANEKCLHIISNTYDRFHNGDVHSVCEDLCQLHQRVVACLPNLPEVFLEGGDRDKGKYEISEEFTEVTIVDDSGSIKIPRKWMPLLHNEKIICTYGEVYRMTCMQWVKSILTCGYYYCTEIRHLKFARSACVLTNKRIIVMDIFQRAGTVPEHMANFSVQTRSILPRKIWGGFVRSMGPKSLKASIWTDAGEVNFKFPSGRIAIPFANALQRTVTRRDSNTKFSLNDVVEKPELDSEDKKLIALLDGEVPISKFKGVYIWLPYGTNVCLLNFVNSIRAYFYMDPVSHACSKEVMGCCFPYVNHIFSCALRPFKSMTDVVVTPNALVSYIRERNYGFCGFGEKQCTGWCVTVDKYTVTWVSSDKFLGHSLEVKGKGNENPVSRVFRKTCCGAMFCPIGTAKYTLTLDLDQVAYALTGTDVNKNWLLDEDLIKGLKCLDMIQVQTNLTLMEKGEIVANPQVKSPKKVEKSADFFDIED